MSELKAFVTREGFMAYLKSEVDKVIAELKNKNHELYERWFEANKKLEGWLGKVQRCENAEQSERHQKRKRCLAMAKICEDKLGTIVKPAWWDKWRKCWLALADEPTWAKFLQLIHKEGK